MKIDTNSSKRNAASGRDTACDRWLVCQNFVISPSDCYQIFVGLSSNSRRHVIKRRSFDIQKTLNAHGGVLCNCVNQNGISIAAKCHPECNRRAQRREARLKAPHLPTVKTKREIKNNTDADLPAGGYKRNGIVTLGSLSSGNDQHGRKKASGTSVANGC